MGDELAFGERYELEIPFLYGKTSGIFPKWTEFKKALGKFSEYDTIYNTRQESYKFEVKAQKGKDFFIFEYKQLMKGRIDNINNWIPSGINLSTARYWLMFQVLDNDTYNIYRIPLKDIIVWFKEILSYDTEARKQEDKFWDNPIGTIPNFYNDAWMKLKGEIPSPTPYLGETPKGIIKSFNKDNTFSYTANLGWALHYPINLIPEKYKININPLTITPDSVKDKLKKTQIKKMVEVYSSFSVKDKNKPFEEYWFPSNLNIIRNNIDYDFASYKYEIKIFGSGKHDSSSESDSSSSSEDDGTCRKIFNRIKRNIEKKYKGKKDKYL